MHVWSKVAVCQRGGKYNWVTEAQSSKNPVTVIAQVYLNNEIPYLDIDTELVFV
jgi:hypothetical protein